MGAESPAPTPRTDVLLAQIRDELAQLRQELADARGGPVPPSEDGRVEIREPGHRSR